MSAMTTNTAIWQDRWTKPTVEALLGPINVQHQPVLRNLIERLNELEGVKADVVWYGPGWRWTIEYRLADVPATGDPAVDPTRVLCYIVPDPIAPSVCIPLTEAFIDALPWRRLTRFIRDGIRSAKCAVAIHWGVWLIMGETESKATLDLITRKLKFLTTARADD